jgi:hypothetical protein
MKPELYTVTLSLRDMFFATSKEQAVEQFLKAHSKLSALDIENIKCEAFDQLMHEIKSASSK